MASNATPGTINSHSNARPGRAAAGSRPSMRHLLTRSVSSATSRKLRLFFWQLAGLLCLQASCLLPSFIYGQALPAAETRASFGVFATASVANTQLPYFADNALGYNFGAFLQTSPLFGLELRVGAYPLKATFEQEPVTAGFRFAPPHTKEVEALPFAYFGAGYSKSQYSKADYQPSVALWTPCWQTSGGMDIAYDKFRWRVYEASWTETFTLRRNLRTLGLSTGLVYAFGR